MFHATTYIGRREGLRERLRRGVVLLLGNEESPMNCADNPFPFRQDSTFLYYFGLDRPGLAAVIDLDEGQGREIVFGDEASIDDVVWTGVLSTVAEQSRAVLPDHHDRQRLDAAQPLLRQYPRLGGDMVLCDCGAETARHYADFIAYDRLEAYRDFGGIRNEEDFVITETGRRRLGKPKPKTVAEVEALRT